MTLPAPLAPMGRYAQFITYYLRPKADKPGKMDKVPCSWRTGKDINLMNAANWGSYEQATGGVARADQGHGSGVGFVFTADDPFWFLDIDNALVDGQWSPTAAALYNRTRGAAVEVSQSGEGMHIFGSGTLPEHGCDNHAAMLGLYHKDRFVALTMRCYPEGTADAEVPAIAAIAAEYFPPAAGGSPRDQDWTTEPCEGYDQALADDAVLLARALKTAAFPAPPGATAKASMAQLWANEEPGSEGDQALANHLAFWTGKNCERIEHLMRQSDRVRDKWDRNSAYLEPTILKACAYTTSIAQPRPAPEPQPAPAPVETPAGRTLTLDADQANDKANHLTVEYWLAAAGVSIRFDEFADVIRVGSEKLTDHLEREMWFAVRECSGLKIAKDLFADVLRNVAYRERFHPIRDHLAQVQPLWDGTPRLDSWMARYLGVERSPYSDAVGALFLVAAVRRARQPGAKFDEMLVLEGPQGTEKSTAIATLCANRDWFTDELHVGMSSKELLEVTAGKWIVEAPELSRMSGSEVEHIKAMLARQFDRARMAYDRNITDRGRQFVPFGTTNTRKYLNDPTGNRRIWPVRVGAIDLAGLEADRTQLWAEAAVREATGASIRLPRSLWKAAGEEQQERVVVDPLIEALDSLLGDKTGRIRSIAVFEGLRIPIERQAAMSRRIGEAMTELGWVNKRISNYGERTRFYIKGEPAREIALVNGKLEYKEADLRFA